jgi:hypothetical protein
VTVLVWLLDGLFNPVYIENGKEMLIQDPTKQRPQDSVKQRIQKV